MFSFALQWARSLGHRFFLQFGLHCATHQIRVILISGVVITSLFYPALDVYTSSRTSSQSIIDALLSPNTNPLRAELDLVDLWSGYDTLRVHEDPVTRAKCSNGHALRVERILIQSQLVEDDGALNHKILLSTYDLERRIQQLASDTTDFPCLKNPNGECLVISPLAFWGYDRDALSSDENILNTLSYSNNVSIVGIPVTPHMVLAGRGSYEPHVGGGNTFDYATYLVLSLFFPRNACWGSSSEHSQWIQFVQTAAGQYGEVDVQLPGATLIALEHDMRASSTNGWSVISAFLYLAYIGFFAYVAWSVRRMDAIHSRLGITFTALVEIAVSTITSLSVCALVGFKITLVPWEVLPIVIVFVGAENMFNLVDAVGKTSVTLSVKQRIAEGLSRAGTSNTLKVVSYNVILGVIAVFSVGAVRQFCAFAIVVLVAHWFLAHTFFMAVLSIDIARLELEELLRHDTSLVPTAQMMQNGNDAQNLKQPRSSLQKLVFTIKQLLQGRAATNISLLMLLAIAATLYYTTYTTSTSIPPPSVSSLQRLGAIARKKTSVSPWNSGLSSYPSSLPALSTADQIWKTLNPTQTPLLHLRIEPPIKVTFNPHGHPSIRSTSTSQSRYTMSTVKIVLRLLTIMVVPIAATTGVLYGLLLYLLKNTELLEAQRHRLGADDEGEASSLYAKHGSERWNAKKTLEGEVKFSTLPRTFSSDVELVSSSTDGKVIVSVGFHNEVVVWNAEAKMFVVRIDAGEIFLRMMGAGLGHGVALGMMPATSSLAYQTITCITVDEEGKYLAVGTTAGSVAAWGIESSGGSNSGVLRPLSVMMRLEGSASTVAELRFMEARKKNGRNFPPNGLGSEPNSPESKMKKGKGKDDAKAVKLLATYTNGMAVKWVIGSANDHPHAVDFSPSGEATAVRAVLLPSLANGQTFIGLCLSDGTLELVEAGSEETFFKPCILQAGNPQDLVWKIHACQTEIGGLTRLVVIAATEAGVISLWDGFTGECISILDGAASGKVNQLRISPVHCETCHFCGQLPMESLSLAFSVDHVVRIEKLYVDETNMTTVMGTRRCSCSKASMQLQHHAHTLSRVSSMEKITAGRRSRSNSSAAYSPSGSPRLGRIRLATAFESSSVIATTSAFPISGHGVHSRRASEKDGMPRRSSELLAVPPFPSNGIVLKGDDHHDGGNGDLAHSTTTPAPSGYSIWRNATVVYLTSITFERGGWDTSGNMYKGIRRKNRLQSNSTKMTGKGSGLEEGLTSATLERWEVWSFDPATATLRCSSLLSLTPEPSNDTESPPPPSKDSSHTLLPSSPKQKTTTSPFSFTSPRTPSHYPFSKPGKPLARLPFTRVSPILISPSHAVAGFGNTIGVFHFAS